MTSFIASSEAVVRTLALAKRFAVAEEPILIEGETGTGKSLLAHLIFEHARHHQTKFVEIPCSSFNENLIESELFGHVRGAFTGAQQANAGKLLQAHQGTLFLDEIGELSLHAQIKFLHFLQEKTFYRVGGNTAETADIRVIAATNRNLLQEVKKGRFREDLYFRLAVLTIQMPPLRERPDDALAIAQEILAQKNRGSARSVRFGPRAMEQILQYSWPGNVRELQNVVKRTWVCLDPDVNEIDLLQFDSQMEIVTPAHVPEPMMQIREALVRNQGCLAKTAKELGLSRYALYRKLKKMGLSKNQAITQYALQLADHVPSAA